MMSYILVALLTLLVRTSFHCGSINSFAIKAPFSIRNNNQWKKNAIVLTALRNGCSGARSVMPSDLQELTTKRGTPCRFKQGVFYFRNLTVKLEFPKFPQLPYGHYRMELEAGQQDEKKAEYCFKTVAHVIPKL
ncbi:uncharacterized protein LOC113214744 isoform X4 [Frankliniella occidentalis]|uniref:Uncharacterized protein LOC113214744 isoform X4 n=1 Tax=Frankliniella occidentalis TaxID=133901 RepID=A0A9C6XRH6_FRAOC|nr:uncharacterized protein LOC113214744 isoform X4 [Frankliniella occidentalis]XP_052128429.1 uncharacterized protein LOC113214744 isoform X4 [Frankliniella occidentalis]